MPAKSLFQNLTCAAVTMSFVMLSAFGNAYAESEALESELLGVLYAPLDPPQVVGQDFLIYNVREGGYFKGERLNGALRQPCADWLRVHPNGNFELDVRCTIEADDGSLIHVAYGGIIDMTEATSKKCTDGTEISGSEVYFRTQPRFRTASETYAWLNDVVAIGEMTAVKCGEDSFVQYDVFAVK